MARRAPGMADAHDKLHAPSPAVRHAEGAEIGTGQEGRAAGPCDQAATGMQRRTGEQGAPGGRAG